MAEWFKALVLKTSRLTPRKFESCPFRQKVQKITPKGYFCWLFFVFYDGEMGFVELGLVDGGRGVHHEVDAGTVFGEGDNVADVFCIFKNHENTVDAEGAASVRRGAKLKGVKHAGKAGLNIGVVKT